MPWSEVTVKEQRENFIRDHRLNYYSVTELAERFSVSRKTTCKCLHSLLFGHGEGQVFWDDRSKPYMGGRGEFPRR